MVTSLDSHWFWPNMPSCLHWRSLVLSTQGFLTYRGQSTAPGLRLHVSTKVEIEVIVELPGS